MLELENGGWEAAFNPQLEFLRAAEEHAATLLHAKPCSELSDVLKLHHVVFHKVSICRCSIMSRPDTPHTKINRAEASKPYVIPRGRDIHGRVAMFGRQWRLNDLPTFHRVDPADDEAESKQLVSSLGWIVRGPALATWLALSRSKKETVCPAGTGKTQGNPSPVNG